MKTAPVSVVIPTFNASSMITQAIDSVLAQTVRPAEIIVVDDGSTDDTRQRLAGYPGLVRYVYQMNQGVSAARNRGVGIAEQEFVAFLDADDVWHPRKLQLQMEVFGRHPTLALLGTVEFDWPTREFPNLGCISSAPRVTFVTWPQLVVRNRLATSSIVVRRAVLDQAGTFDTALQGPEDRDIWLRVAEIARVGNLELPLTGYRDVPGSVSKQATRCQTSMLRILQKIDKRELWQGRRLLRRKAYSYVYHSCAYLHGAAGNHRRAIGHVLWSLLWYPFPYGRADVAIWAERPRRLFVNLLRWMRLKRADSPRPAAFADGAADALQSFQPRLSPQGIE